MKSLLKWILKIVLAIVILALVLFIGLVVWLSVTEYKPADRETVTDCTLDETLPQVTDSMTIYSWNIGYAGLGEESDFFMDGGTMTNPPSQQVVEKNMNGILTFIEAQDADAWLLQEVDTNASRTEGMNQFIRLQQLTGSSSFAYNYKCPFVPIPLPPMGRVESGIATLTNRYTDPDIQRISLPCPFSWPVRTAQIKRCLMVTRLPVEGSDKELVLVNLHLEAYDDGVGKQAQTNALTALLQEEYAKGNYVIAGGDFNQTFPGALERYPVTDPREWTPGQLEASSLPQGWQYAYDIAVPSCRLLEKPLDDSCQRYVIDGFILSPNVQLKTVQTVDLGFQYSDHNPVRLEVTLMPAGEIVEPN